MVSMATLPARMNRSAQEMALPYFCLMGHSRRRPLSRLPLSGQLFSALRRAGLVDSTRGPGGGYTLARQTEQVSVAEIILAVENLKNDELQNLGAGQAAQVKSMTGELWTSFNSRVMEYLQSVTLQDLVEQALRQGTVVEERAPAARTKLPLAPKPRPLMARVNVPNSVFALGSMPILQRR